ncbi:MAG: tetratricopeptide repeat protein [Ilumatobacteraceae bacterium]
MAAMLASASVASLPVRELKLARRILSDDSFRLIERSELESELATLDLRTGSDKKARKAFQRSLVEPTDNALAQAQWASKALQSLEVSPQVTEVPFNAEARTRAATEAGRWSDAVDQAVKWLDDQPFDTDAAVLGSYAASLGLNDWSTAIEIARSGLTAQPSHPMLLNNLAYALVEDGQFTAASEALSRVPEADGVGRVPPTATRGLLAFRTGSVQLGRALYTEAIAAAAKIGDRSLEAMARAMLLREELKVGDLQTSSEMAAALQRIAGGLSKEPGVATVLARVADELARATRGTSAD